jgi:hypothetical protein
MTTLPDTLRRIATDPLATADLWGPIVAPLVALLALLAARQYLGRWPDLWRVRRAVLPMVDRLADGDLDEELDVEGVPAEAEVVRGLEEQGSELDVRLGNRRSAGQAIDDIRRRVSAVAKRL